MKILIATPLYPPEIADAALYAKELARRLSARHEVTVITYAHLPEPLPSVKNLTIDKRQSRLARLRAFRNVFATAARDADAIIMINGVSVELPLLLIARPHKTPLVFCAADRAAHARSGIVEQLARLNADTIMTDIPPRKPEILPLEPAPTEALAAWGAAWEAHLARLESLIKKHD